MMSRRLAIRGDAAVLVAAAACFIACHAPSLARAAAADDGAALFRQYCVACHTIGGGRLVGPDLKGVTERRSDAWLGRFISDPARMFKEDPDAAALLKEYGIPMPTLGLSPQQVSALLQYFRGVAPAPAGRPAALLPTLVLSLVMVVVLTLVGLIAGHKKVYEGAA